MATLQYQYSNFFNPVINALRKLGGSGSNEEINNHVAEMFNISSEELEILHNPEKGGMTEFEYRLMWTRTYLKLYGLIENSSRGIWAFTDIGSQTTKVDEKEVVRAVRVLMKKHKKVSDLDDEEPNKVAKWQEELLGVILQMKPDAFERLIQRMLRESGFIQVDVTGKTGDGGIDGHGIFRLGGFLSFQVIFQAKRWKNAVGAKEIRDFRGAMVGRADKGLLITTGTFTKEAVKEAGRDGAPAIDLIDGDQLVEKLKQLSLGVATKKVEVEQVTVDQKWFLTV